MLNKLTSIPSLLRLSLCLLVSAGIHGGVAYYEWASQPATLHDGQSAVVVALVSAADEPAFAVVDSQDPLEEKSQPVPEQETKAKAAPNVPSRPDVKPLRANQPKPKPVVKAAAVVEEVVEECVLADPVCEEPREILSGPPKVVASIGVSAPEAQVAPPADNRLTGRKAAGQTDADLVEAMPNYRSNPLPEYPYIARQRHWEGVVWLLVDVSAKGLVEDVDVEQSCGHRVLDRAASRTVWRWEFTPATRAGLPVESQVRIPVRFSLEDS